MELSPIFLIAGAVSGVLLSLLYVLLVTRRRPSEVLTSPSMLAATFAALAAFLGISVALFQQGDTSLFRPKTDFTAEQILQTQSRVSVLAKQLEALETALQSATAASLQAPQKGVDPALLAAQQRDLAFLKDAVRRFEGLLLTDAEKLLTLPLLKRDMDVFRSEISSMKAQMELQTKLLQEAQGQGRWIIGTLGFGILALLVPIFRSSFGKAKEDENVK